MTKVTEQASKYRHLEKMSVEDITQAINQEDKTIAVAIEKALPALNRMILAFLPKLKQGGRLFYLGAGSGGRLSVLDAIEMPNTYGVSKDIIKVILAGGVNHLVEALEDKEDDIQDGINQLKTCQVGPADFVIGISASGSTPFVVESLKYCKKMGISTGCIVSNPNSEIVLYADFPVEVITGPEFVSGSTRMKCGTAQKMIFDIISTTTMIQLGRVEDNRMVYVNLINNKLIDRAVRMLMEKTGETDYALARKNLLKAGSVKNAMSDPGIYQ